MKLTLIKKCAVIASIAFFSQFSLAQDANAALSDVAKIVASINHFPSDADKAKLATISGNEAYPDLLRRLATSVSNISHAPTAEGKAVMAEIQATADVPESAKTLAGIIANLNHVPSADDKATIAQLFP